MNWNRVDVEAARKEAGLDDKETNKLNFTVEDEDGNDLLDSQTTDDVVADEDESKKQDEVVVADADKADADKKQAGAADDKKQEEPKKSRAQERIRELVKQKKEAEQKLQAENEQLRRQLLETSKESVDSQRSHLDARIKEVKKSLSQAQEEGKFSDATEYMANLNELQTQKTVADSYSQKFEREAADKKAAATRPNRNEEEFDKKQVLGWVIRNKEWWKKDDAKTTLAVELGKSLESEGLDPSTREYYDELDDRIAEFIGDNDVSDKTNNNEDKQSSTTSDGDKTKKPPQTSSGASRGSAVTSKNGKKVVHLKATEREMARKLGMTDLEWAKQKVRLANNKDENGYQMVFDK